MNRSEVECHTNKMIQAPIKILFVTRDLFPPFRVDVSVLFGKEIAGKGHKIDWVMQSQDECGKGYKERWQGGTAWVGPTNTGEKFAHRVHRQLLGFLHNAFCARLLLRKRYDVIQVKDRFFTAVFYLAIARLFGTKYVFWLSFPFAEASLYEAREGSARYPAVSLVRGLLYRCLLYRIILAGADHVFVQSDQMKRDIQDQGIDGQKMTVVPMGFEDDAFAVDCDEKRADLLDGQNHPRIIYLGTLIAVRRIDFMIRVLSMVLHEIPEARLYLIGSGETKEDIEMLKRAARNLDVLDAVVFTGFMERSKALMMVRAGNVCVSPFYPTPILNSTSPTKLMEYMALGKAVVANEHPEQKRIIAESGGGICVKYNEKAFADAIVYLLRNPGVAEKMGRMGRNWVFQNRTYSTIADGVERIYYSLLA